MEKNGSSVSSVELEQVHLPQQSLLLLSLLTIRRQYLKNKVVPIQNSSRTTLTSLLHWPDSRWSWIRQTALFALTVNYFSINLKKFERNRSISLHITELCLKQGLRFLLSFLTFALTNICESALTSTRYFTSSGLQVTLHTIPSRLAAHTRHVLKSAYSHDLLWS